MGNIVFYLFFSLPMTIAMRSLLLNDIVSGLREDPVAIGEYFGWIDSPSQEMPTSAANDALIPVKKAF